MSRRPRAGPLAGARGSPLTAGLEPRVTARRIGYRVVLTVHGDADAMAGAELTCAFWDAVEVGAQEVMIDLGGAARLDRDGQDAIEGLACSAHELGRTLVLVCPHGAVRHLIATLPPTADVELYETVSAAVRERW